jgi:hypothetical protein
MAPLHDIKSLPSWGDAVSGGIYSGGDGCTTRTQYPSSCRVVLVLGGGPGDTMSVKRTRSTRRRSTSSNDPLALIDGLHRGGEQLAMSDGQGVHGIWPGGGWC